MNTNNIKTGNVNIPGPLHSTASDSQDQIGNVVAYAGDIYDTTLGKNQSQINQEFSESISSSSAPTYSSGLGIIISNNTINVDASQLNYDDLNGKPDLDPLIATHDDRGVVLSYANQGAYAIGDQSVAYGHSTNALGDYSIAGGNGTRAWGDKSVAFGTDTIACGDNAIAAGNGSVAFGTESVALGEKAYTKGKASGYFGKGRSVSAYVIDSEVGVANSDPWYTLSLESSASSAAGYPDGRGTEDFRVLPGMYITEYGTDDYPQQPGWLIKNVEYIPMNLDWVCKVYIDDPNDDAPSDPQRLVVRGIVSEGYSYALGRYLFTTNQSEVAVGDYNVSHKSGGSAASGSGTIFSVGTGVLSDNSEYIPESMVDPENYLISNQTYRANALEVLTNGSVYIRDVGGYDGKSIANVDSLQTVITAVDTRLATLEDVLITAEDVTYDSSETYTNGTVGNAIQTGITSVAASASAAASSASTASGYYSDILTAMGNLGSGEAVAAQVAINQADIAELKSDIVVDLSVRYATSYANLSAALTALNSDTATDATAIKKAGVSVKFINSTTNKYEQWNLKASSWSTNTSDWALDVDGSITNGKLKLPFELEKPSPNEYVTQTSEIGHNGEPLDDVLEGLDNISKESTQSEEDAIIYETDGGVKVGKIDANGADFANLKRGGEQVARVSDLPEVPTLDTSIGSNPSNSHTPSTKAVKDYVDDNIPEVQEYPIETEEDETSDEKIQFTKSSGEIIGEISDEGLDFLNIKKNGKEVATVEDIPDMPFTTEDTSSDESEQVWQNEAGTDTYVRIGEYGIRAKKYMDMDGNDITEGAAPFEDVGKYYGSIRPLVENAHKGSDFACLFFSDIHKGSTNVSGKTYANIERIIAYANSLGANLLDCVVNGGDTVEGNVSVGALSWYNTRVATSGIPFITAAGNHDCWKSYGADQMEGTDLIVYNELMPTILAQNPTLVQPASPTDGQTYAKNYYYKDINNVRLIVLDSERSRRVSSYKTEQLQWFTEVALADTAKTVVCVSHHGFDAKSSRPIPNIVSWNDDCTFTSLYKIGDGSYLSEDYATAIDGFIASGGKFACWLTGHLHVDYLGNLSAHNNQLQIGINTARGGNSNGYCNDTDRSYNTINYDCFNYISIDTDRSIINIVRIGNNSDYNLRSKLVLSYDYENHNIVYNN